MKDSLYEIENKYDQINEQLKEESVLNDIKLYTKLTKEANKIKGIVETFDKFLLAEQSISESKLLLNEDDEEIIQLAKQEIITNEKFLPELEEQLKLLLLPKDEDDDKDVIVEIRGAACGDEANIFAGDLYKIYTKYAENNNWKEKIRTYNYPQDRLTDHRISYSCSLRTVTDEKLDTIIDALIAKEQAEKIKSAGLA